MNGSVMALALIGAELRRTFRLIRSYWLEYISDFFTYVVGFLLLMAVFWSASDNFGVTGYLAALIGYVTWKMCASVMLDVALTPVEEAQTGTLEQLLLSKISPGWVFLSRTVGFIFENGLRSFFLGLFLAFVGKVLQPVSFLALVVFILTLGGAIGLGFALAGVGLIFKQTSRLPTLLWQMLVFFTGALAPIRQPVLLGISKLLPLTWGITALRAIYVENASFNSLWESGMMAGLFINTAIYILLGVFLFVWGQKQARSLGTLAHY